MTERQQNRLHLSANGEDINIYTGGIPTARARLDGIAQPKWTGPCEVCTAPVWRQGDAKFCGSLF